MKQRRWRFGTAIRTWTLHMTTCCKEIPLFSRLVEWKDISGDGCIKWIGLRVQSLEHTSVLQEIIFYEDHVYVHIFGWLVDIQLILSSADWLAILFFGDKISDFPVGSHPDWTFETPGWTGRKFCPMPQVPSVPWVPGVPCPQKKNRNAKVQNLRLWEMVGVRVWWSKKASNAVSFLKAFGAWCGNYIFLMITFHSEWWWYATIFEKMIWLQEETSVLSALFINFLDINLNRDQKWWAFWDPGSSETAERWVYMGPAQHPRNWW